MTTDRHAEVLRGWSFLPANQIPPLWWVPVAAVLISIDYLTGPYFQFPAVYFVPIAMAAWFSGQMTGVVLAVFLPISRYALMLAVWHEPWDPQTILATAITRIVVFVAMAIITARLARHERALREREAFLEKEAATLRSLLPICAGCRRIRDGDEWDTLDAYVSRRREEFGTGMCPTCAGERFPEHFPPPVR